MIWLLSSFLLILSPCHGIKDSVTGLLQNLKKSYPNWSPRAILDIGANAGHWSANVRKEYPDSKIIMLEADDQHVSNLEATVKSIGNAIYKIAVMGENDGDVVSFYSHYNHEFSTGNSMFKENSRLYRKVESVKKKTFTLDKIIEEEKSNSFLSKNNQEVDFIKIDVQGAELMVLKGGIETLRGATFVQFEGSTVEFNAGAACTHEVDDFLRSNGFFLYDHAQDQMHHILFKTYGLGQWDLLYVRPDSKQLPIEMKKKNSNFCGSRVEKPNKTQRISQRTFTTPSGASDWYFGLITGLFIGIIVCYSYQRLVMRVKTRRELA